MPYSVTNDNITNSSSPDEIDHYTASHSMNRLLSQNYPSTPNRSQSQSINTQTHELEAVW